MSEEEINTQRNRGTDFDMYGNHTVLNIGEEELEINRKEFEDYTYKDVNNELLSKIEKAGNNFLQDHGDQKLDEFSLGFLLFCPVFLAKGEKENYNYLSFIFPKGV